MGCPSRAPEQSAVLQTGKRGASGLVWGGDAGLAAPTGPVSPDVGEEPLPAETKHRTRDAPDTGTGRAVFLCIAKQPAGCPRHMFPQEIFFLKKNAN